MPRSRQQGYGVKKKVNGSDLLDIDLVESRGRRRGAGVFRSLNKRLSEADPGRVVM